MGEQQFHHYSLTRARRAILSDMAVGGIDACAGVGVDGMSRDGVTDMVNGRTDGGSL